MNINISTTIKRLRAENNETQESLATAIGVTPQAISRWESGGGYPDIELLPALADFFSVSIDELLGYKLSEREEELARIKKEMARLSEVGTVKERLAFARSSAIRFPRDFEIKNNLAVCLYFLWSEEPNYELSDEIETICQTIISQCNDDDIYFDTINLLIALYRETKQYDKAKDTVNMLTPMKYCREFTKAWGIGDNNTELYIQEAIYKLTDSLGVTIRNLAINDDLPNDPSTWDKKIAIIKTSNEIYSMIYGDDLMFFHNRLAFNHWLISTYEISLGRNEDSLLSLKEMCHHAIEYDKSYRFDHGKNYSSIFTDKIRYHEPGKDSHELTEHTLSYYMTDRLKSDRYDCVRNDSRFIDILNVLDEYSK